jgi:[acyl-carrier-protein] S-malonyltransferase
VALLFPGQGAQKPGMGKSLLEKYEPASSYYEKASSILGYDLAQLCTEGSAAELNKTSKCQPALYVTCYVDYLRILEENPELVSRIFALAGLSLGELSALCAAGVYTFEDGLQLVKTRAESMQDRCSSVDGGMLVSIGLSQPRVQAILQEVNTSLPEDQHCSLGSIMGERNFVISGLVETLKEVQGKLKEEGANASSGDDGTARVVTKVLNVDGPFHSVFMKDSVPLLKEAVKKSTWRTPLIPVFSNVDGRMHFDIGSLQQNAVYQLEYPALWKHSIQKMVHHGVTEFYEMGVSAGVGRQLSSVIKREVEGGTLPSEVAVHVL